MSSPGGVIHRLDQLMNNSDFDLSPSEATRHLFQCPVCGRPPLPRTVSSEFLDGTPPSSRPIFADPETGGNPGRADPACLSGGE